MAFVIILVLLIYLSISSGQTWYLIFPILMIVIPVAIALGNTSNTSPTDEPPPKRRNQTEDEFNEMAITTMYANQWLDEDND